jgi:hypothetical protein
MILYEKGWSFLFSVDNNRIYISSDAMGLKERRGSGLS